MLRHYAFYLNYNMIKNLINAIRIYKLIVKYPAIFKVTEQIFATLNQVATDQRPRTQNIIIDFKSDLVDNARLDLWVCHGEGNPVQRIAELRKEVDILKAEQCNQI